MRAALTCLLLLAPLAACTPPAELDSDDLEPSGPAWDELVRAAPAPKVIAAGLKPQLLPPAAATPSLDDLTLTPERLAALPHAVRAQPQLASLALTHELDQPEPYEKGLFSLRGSSKVFVAPLATIKDYDRLYWVMVKVLSEKYGCFMVRKLNQGDVTRIDCRDKRQVVFWKSKGPGWIRFVARQFDREGYEIMVRKKRIVRISNERVI